MRIKRLARLTLSGIETASALSWVLGLGGGFLLGGVATILGFWADLPWALYVPLGVGIGLLVLAAILFLRGVPRAIRTLKPYATKYSRAKIVIFPSYRVPLGRRIANIFELAEWRADFNETPQEPFNPTYVEGVEISGINRELVRTVRNALRQAKVKDLRETIMENRIGQDNPKYPHAVYSVRITIGHPVEEVPK